MATNVPKFMEELDGGVFEEKLSAVLSDVAAGVIDHNKVGEVTIKLKLKKVGRSPQVMVDHRLTFKRPTLRGSYSEEEATETPMHVGKKGAMTFFPEDQWQLFSEQDRDRRPEAHHRDSD